MVPFCWCSHSCVIPSSWVWVSRVWQRWWDVSFVVKRFPSSLQALPVAFFGMQGLVKQAAQGARKWGPQSTGPQGTESYHDHQVSLEGALFSVEPQMKPHSLGWHLLRDYEAELPAKCVQIPDPWKLCDQKCLLFVWYFHTMQYCAAVRGMNHWYMQLC